MNIEEIEKFLAKKTTLSSEYVKISFKNRDAIYGLFIKDKDYSDLKAKNFWRIVPQSQFVAYNQSHNISLAKIFNGGSFHRLATHHGSFD